MKARGARFTGAVLNFAYAFEANFTEADLSNAHVEGATFTGANLTDAKFDNADLSYARMERAVLTGATFTGATLIGTRMPEAPEPVPALHPEPALYEVKITRSCALVSTCYGEGDAPDVAIRYIEYAEFGSPDQVTEAKIDADKARDIVALLAKAFGPGVLPAA